MTVLHPSGAKQQRLEFHSPWVSFPEKYVTCHKADQNLGFLRNVYINIYITIDISTNPFVFSQVVVFLFLMLVSVVNEIIISSWHSLLGTELYSPSLACWHHGEWSVLPCPIGSGPSHCFTLADEIPVGLVERGALNVPVQFGSSSRSHVACHEKNMPV